MEPMTARDKPDQDQAPEDETKRKFREALAAKRNFRRKTG
jgi:hypothetical protein